MSKSTDSSISFGVGLLFGVVSGVVAGVLLTPKSGEEVRSGLVNVVESIAAKDQRVEKCKSASIKTVARVRYVLERQISKLTDAIKAGRMAAAKNKEELESGYRY